MQIPRPPKTITLDCWSTLITDVSWEDTMVTRIAALKSIAAREGVSIDDEKARELIEGSWDQHVQQWRKGRLYGAPGASRWCLDQLGIFVGEHLADELAEAIAGATSEVGTRVVDGAREAVDMVREAGIQTALICDTGFTPGSKVRGFLENHGIELDHYFFSDEVGAPKPFRPMFDAALTATRATAEQCVHIGDLRRTDIAGARSAGMATVRFIGVHDDGWNLEEVTGEEADAVLAKWSELGDLIGLS